MTASCQFNTSLRSAVFLIGVLITPASASPPALPRFTEEREVAAMFFVKKHLPELIPLLDDLRKNSRPSYEQEVREIFQVTEILADLLEDPKRHERELRYWKAENRALIVVARLSTSKKEDREKLETQLRELAKELVEIDVQLMESHLESLEKAVLETKEELHQLRDNLDKTVKDRYESLIEKVKKRKK